MTAAAEAKARRARGLDAIALGALAAADPRTGPVSWGIIAIAGAWLLTRLAGADRVRTATAEARLYRDRAKQAQGAYRRLNTYTASLEARLRGETPGGAR